MPAVAAVVNVAVTFKSVALFIAIVVPPATLVRANVSFAVLVLKPDTVTLSESVPAKFRVRVSAPAASVSVILTARFSTLLSVKPPIEVFAEMKSTIPCPTQLHCQKCRLL